MNRPDMKARKDQDLKDPMSETGLEVGANFAPNSEPSNASPMGYFFAYRTPQMTLTVGKDFIPAQYFQKSIKLVTRRPKVNRKRSAMEK
jgi:hypothetical protein